MPEKATTALDVIGLLLIAAGLTTGLWPHLGAFAAIPAGAFLLAASGISAAVRAHQARVGKDEGE